MSTSTTSSTRTFAIREFNGQFVVDVLIDGVFVDNLRTRRDGLVRYFNSRSGARKAITRELRGDYR